MDCLLSIENSLPIMAGQRIPRVKSYHGFMKEPDDSLRIIMFFIKSLSIRCAAVLLEFGVGLVHVNWPHVGISRARDAEPFG